MSYIVSHYEERAARQRPMKVGEIAEIVRGVHRHFPTKSNGIGEHLRQVLIRRPPGDMSIHRIHCKRCIMPRWAVEVLAIRSNGVRIASKRCLACGYENATRGAKPSDVDLPLWEDGTSDAPCERCGSTDGVEVHHWAPRHLFDDADQWPMSDLCRPCHALWHRLVTPEMGMRKTA